MNHLTAILNDFLSLGKLEEGRVEIVIEEINIPEFLREIQEELKSSLKAEQKIVVYIPEEHRGLRTDPRILRNILFNLISNASKYSDENRNIYLTCAFRDEHVRLSVKDEGIGIPEDDKKHMFDRFFRASNAINIQGTGLGLNIVKRYIDLLNGKIEFESEYGKGSTFTIEIPIENK